VSFYLPALAVAAAILPPIHAVALAVFSIVCYSLLTSYYVPLHIADPDRAVTYHLSGMWANFALSAGLITWFVARMSRALRARDAQLTRARELHMQGERIIALATQAASAAHEMGTPLATVALITDELRHETKFNSALAAYSADLQTIEAQIALCKTALAKMGMQVGAAAETDTDAVDLPEWLTQFVAQWRLCHPTARLQFTLAAGTCLIVHSRAVGQMLQTMLDNARYASAAGDTTIHVSLVLQPRAALVQVTDAGTGIAPALLNRLGYEVVQSTSGGKGIGLMLAFATARQIGATLVLSSAESQGTSATITLALA
jgi:two-component system sensor histidine kinase RegB